MAFRGVLRDPHLMAEIVERPEAPANDPDLARLVAALGGGPGDHSEPAPRDLLVGGIRNEPATSVAAKRRDVSSGLRSIRTSSSRAFTSRGRAFADVPVGSVGQVARRRCG
jgi:hypothetical protein